MKKIIYLIKFFLYHCRDCEEEFNSRREYNTHQSVVHPNADQPWPWDENAWGDRPKEVLQRYAFSIRGGKIFKGTARIDYNFVSDNLDSGSHELTEHLREIYRNEEQSFKVNFSLGLVLKNRENGEERYFAPYTNSMVLKKPYMITSPASLKQFLEKHIKTIDVEKYINEARQNSKWVPTFISNVKYYVYPTGYVLAGKTQLPNYICQDPNIVGMTHDPFNRHMKFKDKKCFFRCLAYHRRKEDNLKHLEKKTEMYYRHFLEETSKDSFSVNEILEAEQLFKVNIRMYSKLPSGSVRKVYGLKENIYDDTLILNVFGKKESFQHLSYVKNPTAYLKIHQCRHCEKVFRDGRDLNRHERVCFENVKLIVKTETFLPPRTIMKTLVDMELISEKVYYPYFAFFDIECMLKKIMDGKKDNMFQLVYR